MNAFKIDGSIIKKEVVENMEIGRELSVNGKDENGFPCVMFKIWRLKKSLFIVSKRSVLLKYRMSIENAFSWGLKHVDYEYFSFSRDVVKYINKMSNININN